MSATITMAHPVDRVPDPSAFETICTSLASITIPSGVASVGELAFSKWTSSQRITVQGRASQEAADRAWGANWRADSNATIVYGGQ